MVTSKKIWHHIKVFWRHNNFPIFYQVWSDLEVGFGIIHQLSYFFSWVKFHSFKVPKKWHIWHSWDTENLRGKNSKFFSKILWRVCPAKIYLFKVSYGNTKTMGEICSKLIINTSQRRHWCYSGVLFVKPGNI